MSQQIKRLPTPLRACLLTVATVTLVSLLIAVWSAKHVGIYLGFLGLWIPGWGNDYICYVSRFPLRHSVRFFTAPGFGWFYPAPAIFVYYPFYMLLKITSVHRGYAVLVGTITGSGVLLGVAVAKRMVREGLRADLASGFVAAMLLLSWPLYFAAQRGNIEGITWVLVAAGIWCFCRGKMAWSAVCLGIVGCFKIYPLLFFALFLKRRADRRWILLGAVVVVSVTLLGLRFLEPNVMDSMKRTASGVREFTRVYAEAGLLGPWDHSGFGLMKVLGNHFHPNIHRELMLYYPVAAGIAVVLAFRAWRFPLTNQVLFLTCAAITLPPTSYDYTLCLLYVPFVMVLVQAVKSARTRVPLRGLTLAMVLFGLALAPDMFAPSGRYFSVPGAIRCCFLIALALLSVSVPLELGLQGSVAKVDSSMLTPNSQKFQASQD